ncbi:MAG: hypothetical protein ACFFFG_18425 [Candidatus Thorarchaeota archaeon]
MAASATVGRAPSAGGEPVPRPVPQICDRFYWGASALGGDQFTDTEPVCDHGYHVYPKLLFPTVWGLGNL